MFKFKKKATPKQTVTETIMEATVMEKKEYPKIVHEIHNTFMNAGEKLLSDAKNIIANAEVKDEEKISRLKKIGFINAGQVKDAEEKIKQKQKAEADAKIVEYYAVRYPQYKFITEEIVETICKKYNLVLGGINQYKGFVPEKNLADIENFSVKNEDCLERRDIFDGDWLGIDQFRSFRGLSSIVSNNTVLDDYYRMAQEHELRKQQSLMRRRPTYELPEFPTPSKESEKTYLREFKICAPENDMNTSGYTKQGHKLIPDPVVLHPVKNGYLIVTAWGDEASDENVVNQKMN